MEVQEKQEVKLSQKNAGELLELFAEINKKGIYNVYDCKSFSKNQLAQLFTKTKEFKDLEKQLEQFVIDTKAHSIPEDSDLSIRDFSNIISKDPQDYNLLETWIPKLYKQ